MSDIPEGFSKALEVFRRAAKTVPAYQDFLRRHGIRAGEVSSPSHFSRLPITDKKNYIKHYSFRRLFSGERIPPMIHMSSGSSGKPTFWFRGDEHEEWGGEAHEAVFHDIFGIKKEEPTLVIISFAMGVWVAGTYTLAACREVSRRGYQVSTVTPGIGQNEIFHILRELAPKFNHVILVGYPPFLADILRTASKEGILPSKRFSVLAAADLFSEAWRNGMLPYLSPRDPYRAIVNMYGSADAGVMAHETPLSIFMRRASLSNKEFFRELFGETSLLPGLYQYDPSRLFFEEVNQELILTTSTATPLIRYNTHDVGRVIPYREMVQLLRRFSYFQEAEKKKFLRWKLPFLVIKGRTDVAVTFYGLNIFPEHIRQTFEDSRLSTILSGSFTAYNAHSNRTKRERLYVRFDLHRDTRSSRKILRVVEEALFHSLRHTNTEFRKLSDSLGSRARPSVSLFSFGDERFTVFQARGIISLKGKKPRVVL